MSVERLLDVTGCEGPDGTCRGTTDPEDWCVPCKAEASYDRMRDALRDAEVALWALTVGGWVCEPVQSPDMEPLWKWSRKREGVAFWTLRNPDPQAPLFELLSGVLREHMSKDPTFPPHLREKC